jgi:hypothetical protein
VARLAVLRLTRPRGGSTGRGRPHLRAGRGPRG